VPELTLVLNEEKIIWIPRLVSFTISDPSLLTGYKNGVNIHLTGIHVGTGTIKVYKAAAAGPGGGAPEAPITYNITVHPIAITEDEIVELQQDMAIVGEAYEEFTTTNIAEGIADLLEEGILPDPVFDYSTLTPQNTEDIYTTVQISQNTTCKDYLLMESANVNLDFEFESQSLIELDQYPEVADTLRAKTGNYWTHVGSSGENVLTYFRKEFSEDIIPLKLSFTHPASQNQGAYGLEDPSTLTTSGLFFGTTETIVLTPNNNVFQTMVHNEGTAYESVFMSAEYKTFIEEAVPLDEWFTDHTCVINAFYKQKEIENMAAGTALCYAEIKDQYNTYIEPYELALKDNDQIKEWTLPNLYAFYLMKGGDSNPDFKDLITLLNAPEITNTLGDHPQGEYYTKYAFYRNENQGTGLENLDRWKNIAVPYEAVEDNIKYNWRANLFPMSVNINFKTDSRTEFADSLQGDNSTMFLKHIIHKLNTEGQFNLMPTWEYGKEKNNTKVIKQIDLTEYITKIRDFELADLPQFFWDSLEKNAKTMIVPSHSVQHHYLYMQALIK
jgi:hypothetical protein